MSTSTKTLQTVTLASLLCFGGATASLAQKADNTKTNQRDRNDGEATADSQKMNASDRALTQKIRQSIMADKSLSTYAHNIKVISQNGTVTLKGPVRSEEEVKAIVAKATAAGGTETQVVNQLSVAP